MKYLTRARWGGGGLMKIPFFKGQQMHKPITLILFILMGGNVFGALSPPHAQMSAHKGTCVRSTPPDPPKEAQL